MFKVLQTVQWFKVLLLSVGFFALFLFILEFKNSLSFLRFTEISTIDRLLLMATNVWSSFSVSPVALQITAVLVSFLAALNSVLVANYFKKQHSVSFGNNFGFFVALVGFGCGACGGIILTYLSFLTGAYTSVVANSHSLAYLGLVLICFSTWQLLRRLSATHCTV